MHNCGILAAMAVIAMMLPFLLLATAAATEPVPSPVTYTPIAQSTQSGRASLHVATINIATTEDLGSGLQYDANWNHGLTLATIALEDRPVNATKPDLILLPEAFATGYPQYARSLLACMHALLSTLHTHGFIGH